MLDQLPFPPAAAALAVVAGGMLALLSFNKHSRRRATLNLQGRWIVVTGCDFASSLGAGTASSLSSLSAKVIAFTLTEAGAQRALEGGAAAAMAVDLTDSAGVEKRAAEAVAACGGRLWAVVHCAGVSPNGHIEYQPLSNFKHTMDVNFFAIVNLTQRLLPALKAERGRVVLVSSVGGLIAGPMSAPYGASKFALEAYAAALRVEMVPFGVSVCVVNPEGMRTPLLAGIGDGVLGTWRAMAGADPHGEWRQVYPEEWVPGVAARLQQHFTDNAQDPAVAVTAIVRAVCAAEPRRRYWTGSAVVVWLVWCMPETWLYAMMRNFYTMIGMQPKVHDSPGGPGPVASKLAAAPST